MMNPEIYEFKVELTYLLIWFFTGAVIGYILGRAHARL